jgi:hypothetical protein
MIEHKSVIGMPMQKMTMLYTVNMNDVCACLAQASLSKRAMVWGPSSASSVGGDGFVPAYDTSSSDSSNELNEQGINSTKSAKAFKRVYELICTQPMNIGMIAESLTKALRETGFTADIEPAKIEDEQLESYLKFIAEQGKKDFKKLDPFLDAISPYAKLRDVGSLQQDTGVAFSSFSCVFKSLFSGTEASNDSHDQPSDPKCLLPCPADVLTPFGIQLVLDHFRRARLLQEPILPNNDIRDVSGREPIELSDFFMRNRRQFRSEVN